MVSEEVQRMGGLEWATEFNNDLREAIIENGNRWRSDKDFVANQIEQARKNPGLFCFGVSDSGRRIAWIPPLASQLEPSTPKMSIPPNCWKPIGEEEPFHRLLAQVQVNGYDFHAEAYEVKYDEDGTMHVLEDGYEGLIGELAPDQCPTSQPITLPRPKPELPYVGQYVIVISPHCE